MLVAARAVAIGRPAMLLVLGIQRIKAPCISQISPLRTLGFNCFPKHSRGRQPGCLGGQPLKESPAGEAGLGRVLGATRCGDTG